MGIKVLDHIIIGDNEYFSFTDEKQKAGSGITIN
jgi:DNA repair protein RadC